MDIAYKVFIAVIAGCLVFFIMKKMTKWVFRIMIVAIIIVIVFYSSITFEDIRGIFNKEPVTQAVEPVPEETPENVTMGENATITNSITSLTEKGQQ